MIRKMQADDLPQVAAIWLAANLQAHSFIPAAYWQDNLAAVRQMLPLAEVYVYAQTADEPLGFVGLNGNYIEGIFVAPAAQSQGIGKKLLDYAKGLHSRLNLRVYQQNRRARLFYQREGFQTAQAGADPNTNAQELLMVWPG